MIYHKWSLVGFMLWIRYVPRGLRAWLSLTQIYASYLESPGTKAYSKGDMADSGLSCKFHKMTVFRL